MKTNPHRWVKPMAVLFTGGLIFGSGGTCVPEDSFFKLGAATRAAVFDTFAVILATGVAETINGAVFGPDAVSDTLEGVDDSTGGDGSGNPDAGPPPFP